MDEQTKKQDLHDLQTCKEVSLENISAVDTSEYIKYNWLCVKRMLEIIITENNINTILLEWKLFEMQCTEYVIQYFEEYFLLPIENST